MKGHLALLVLAALLSFLAIAQETSTRTLAVVSVTSGNPQASTSVASIIDPKTEATDNSSDGDNDQSPSEAGADGPDTGAFKLSKGGLVAIVVVVVVVAVGGIASTALFFIAKKRQWEVRKSIKRASRRLTGRGKGDGSHANRESRRTGVRMSSPPRTGGAKGRGNTSRDRRERDVEKGERRTAAEKGKPTMSTFDMETPVVNSWKDKVFGYKG